MKKAKGALAVLGLAAAVASAAPAFAQDTGFYAGFHLGQSSSSDACTGIPSCDDKDTAWKILGGYQFNKYVAAELGYTDLGAASAPGAKLEATAFEVVAVGSFPVMDKLSIYGKLGLFRGDAEATGPGGSVSETNTDMTWGIGVRYDFTRNLGVRGEWQQYKGLGGGALVETDVDVISVGVLWKF